MNEYDFIIYTRGFFDNSTGSGKWIALITKEKRIIKVLKGKKEKINEARIQLIAVANALSQTQKGNRLLFICDSQYVTNAILRNWYTNWKNKGWITNQGTQVQNQDIWNYFINTISKFELNIDIRWYQDYEEAPIGKKMKALVAEL